MIEKGHTTNNKELRTALYEGTIFHFPAMPATVKLVDDVWELLESALGQDGPARLAQFRLSEDNYFNAIGRLRKIIFSAPRFHKALIEIVNETGFDAGSNAFEPIRLRAISHDGHKNPKAAPIYYAHRDTWYSHPQSLISWWIPLHDVNEEETFVFFPDYFCRAVANGSGEFDYDRWIADSRELRVGWQDKNAGREAHYPSLLEELNRENVISFSCRRAELILFSGAQLHQTRDNTSGQTRFSLDFRTVHLGDYEKGVGAVNVDNRSRGSALNSYIRTTD